MSSTLAKYNSEENLRCLNNSYRQEEKTPTKRSAKTPKKTPKVLPLPFTICFMMYLHLCIFLVLFSFVRLFRRSSFFSLHIISQKLTLLINRVIDSSPLTTWTPS